MAKVLIIEDDPIVSRMHQKIFSFEKYSVEAAADGEAGLQKAQSVNPDIIILDVMLPKMNGLEVLEKLKADPKTQNIPVLILTNLSNEKDAQLALQKGAEKYMLKSESDPKQVVEIANSILAGKTATKEKPQPGTAPQT